MDNGYADDYINNIIEFLENDKGVAILFDQSWNPVLYANSWGEIPKLIE